jgi:hypothetical protein
MGIIVDIERIARNISTEDYPDIKEVDLSQLGLNATGTDAVGRKVFSDCELISKVLGRSFTFPQEIIIGLRKQKNLVVTPVTGNNNQTGGVVVEQLNQSFFEINIKGYLTERDYTLPRYPQDLVQELEEFMNAPEALEVESDYLELHNIRKMVIKSFNWLPLEGGARMQHFTITAFEYRDFLVERRLSSL